MGVSAQRCTLARFLGVFAVVGLAAGGCVPLQNPSFEADVLNGSHAPLYEYRFAILGSFGHASPSPLLALDDVGAVFCRTH